jgi:hypothetical protein
MSVDGWKALFEPNTTPLNAYVLCHPDQLRSFLWRLSEIDEPGLLAAVSHLWDSLLPPREYHAALIGAAAGTGGGGKAALWKLLKAFLDDFNSIDTPDLPVLQDYASMDEWHAACMRHFGWIDEAADAVLSRYSALIALDVPEQLTPVS